MSKQRRLTAKEKRRKDREMGTLNCKFSMRNLEPITQTQEDMFDQYNSGYNVAAIGTAGTGKTMCAMLEGSTRR